MVGRNLVASLPGSGQSEAAERTLTSPCLCRNWLLPTKGISEDCGAWTCIGRGAWLMEVGQKLCSGFLTKVPTLMPSAEDRTQGFVSVGQAHHH